MKDKKILYMLFIITVISTGGKNAFLILFIQAVDDFFLFF